MKNAAKGDLIIAEPFLNDPNFQRSVVLVCKHGSEGTFGLVLNQVAGVNLPEVLQETIYQDLPLFVGGPVEANILHFVHRRPDLIPSSTKISDGIYWGGDFEKAKEFLNSNAINGDEIRFYVGYSGWSSGQLEEELAAGSWIVTHVDSKFLFSTPPDQFWQLVLKNMGGKYRSMAHYPIDPRVN